MPMKLLSISLLGAATLGSTAPSQDVNFVDHVALIREGRLETGPVDEMVTAERLSRFFGIDVDVARLDGRRVVVPTRELDSVGEQS